jgi:hypothetical protein
VDLACGAFPPVQIRLSRAADNAYPKITARILKQAKRFVATQPVLRRILFERTSFCQIRKRVHGGKLKETVSCRDPPLLHSIVNKQLIPTPGRRRAWRKVDPNVFEPSPVEAVNVIRRHF